ncbi:Crp/Fnr family transcriptional regulator [Pseudoalteromonas mariniglutinosa]|uniref:Crp/Fnr family transcriptional regulator n=1 Tax=Pseudoalteromonas mariniglutinosa TaxID=206042 RepID=UPI0038514EB7
MITSTDRCIIFKGSWFKQRHPHFQQQLLAAAKVIKLNAGEALFLRGDKNTGLYCVLTGIMRVSGVNHSGKEAVLSFIDASFWFGEVALFDGGKRTHDVYAQTAVRLVQVNERSLTALLTETPQYWHDFGLLLTQKIRLLFGSLEDHALLTARQKVCKRLLMLAGDVSAPIDLALSQQQLADMTYLTRQTINQILQRLQAEQVISLHYQKVVVMNKEKLNAGQ